MQDLRTDIKYGHIGKTTLWFLGQAGFIFKSKTGTILGVDLYLSNCGERKYGFKRLMPRLIEPSDLVFDILVCTHEHYDHFDVDSVPIIMSNPYTYLICAKDCRKLIERYEIEQDRVTYIKKDERVDCKDFAITAVFCDHGEETKDAVGLVIELDEKKIYITGDTCLRLDKTKEIMKYGPFDIMIGPINGHFGNMNEIELVELCNVIKPNIVIPCHYWNWAEHGGDPGRFSDLIKQKIPNQKYLIMAQGEYYYI